MIGSPSTVALMVRGLRQDLRLRRIHTVRILFVLLIFASLIATATASVVGAPGLQFFSSNCSLNLAVITIAGLGWFTTGITEEKEEGMIGLLQMANVGPSAMLLGKTIPKLVAAILVVSVQFPFTWLAITLGGVTPQQVAAAYVMQVAYLAMLSGLGLLLSVISRTTGAAAGGAVLILTTFYALAPALDLWFPTRRNLLAEASPFHRLREILQTGFGGPILGWQAASNLCAGIAFFALARVLYPGFVRADQESEIRRPWFSSAGRRARRSKAGILRPGRAWRNAVAWKDFHFVAGGKPLMIFKFLVYGAGFAYLTAIAKTGRPLGLEIVPRDAPLSIVFGALVALVIESVLLASRVFQIEWREKTVPSLAVLPQSLALTLWSKVLGCAVSLAPAAVCLLMIPVVYPREFSELFRRIMGEPLTYWIVFHGICGTLLAAWFSLHSRWGGLVMTGFVLVLPNVCCCIPASGGSAPVTMGGVLILFFTLPLLMSVPGIIEDRLETIAAE